MWHLRELKFRAFNLYCVWTDLAKSVHVMFNCEPARKSVKSGGYPIDNPTPPIYTKSGLAPKTREVKNEKISQEFWLSELVIKPLSQLLLFMSQKICTIRKPLDYDAQVKFHIYQQKF